MISYDKLLVLLKEKGYTTYKIRQEKLMGQRSWEELRKGNGGLSRETLNRLCKVLDCQPGDLMEYIPDEE